MNLSAPRPAIVVFFDHTAQMGGGEVALLHLVTHLDRARFEPVVVLAENGPLGDRLREHGIETHVLLLDETVSNVRKDSLGGAGAVPFAQIGAMFSYIGRLSAFLRAREAQILHTNSLKADVLGALAGRLVGVPILWHVRDRIADDYLPAKAVRVFRVLCRVLPSFVVAPSQATHDTLELPPAKNGAPSGVVWDGLPFSNEPLAVAKENEAPIVGLVGRISPWKGQDVFLQAAALLQEKFPRARFQIIGSPLFGEDDYLAQVRALSRELGLDERVEWLGFRSDVPELLAQMTVFVHASTIGEPFGQVVVEAMRAGRPVVATRGGGVPEIVREGETGFLVPMNDAPAMASAIERVLSDPKSARAMGESRHRRAIEHFSIERTAEGVARVYDFLLAQKRKTQHTRKLEIALFIGALVWWMSRRNKAQG